MTSRVQVEVEIVRRFGSAMSSLKMDGTTKDGTNADIGAALGAAMRDLGYTIVDPVSPSTAEVAAATAPFGAVIDTTMYHAIVSAQSAATMAVDTKSGPLSQSMSQVVANLKSLKDAYAARVISHGVDIPSDSDTKTAFVELVI